MVMDIPPPVEVFSDEIVENDIEKNNKDAGNLTGKTNTFLLSDDDECLVEDVSSGDEDSTGGSNGDGDGDEDFENVAEQPRIFVNTIKKFRDAEAHKNDDDDDDDDDDYNIHDQLPSVEEVKASNAYLPTKRIIAASNRRKLYTKLGAAAFAVLLAIVVFSVGVFEAKHKKKKAAAAAAAAAAANPHSESRMEDVAQFIFHHRVSTLPSFQEIGSPEHNAAAFMAAGDALNMAMSETDELGNRRFLERYILALIYYQTNGDLWDDRYHFLSQIDHCDWRTEYSTPQGHFMKGVQCNDDGFVKHLDLSNNNLNSRYIPQEIVHFQYLEKLHLFGNKISGGIPDLRMLENLVSLGLMNLELTGVIPDTLGTMTKLTALALGQNNFKGAVIPDNFGRLTDLRILGLDNCGVKGQMNPLLYLHKLEALYLEDNAMTGVIYQNEWHNMKELDLSNNQISSRVPENLFTNKNTHVIDLSHNSFFGDFPEALITNTALEYVALQNNILHGTLTDRIGYLGGLKHLDISENYIAGTLPDTIQMCTKLVSLATSGNRFEAQNLKDMFTPLVHLQDLSMKGNAFTGTLPNFFGVMSSLKMLDLDGNNLRGTIPTHYGTLQNLEMLMLNRNDLTGTIPSEIERLHRLEILLLDGNSLHGKTHEICAAHQFRLTHFTTDCYPSMQTDAGPEVTCSCCTLCCNDENPECNDHSWTSSYDPKKLYGYIRPAYEFSLDQAPEGWQKKAAAAAMPSNPGHGGDINDVPAYVWVDDGFDADVWDDDDDDVVTFEGRRMNE